MSTRNTAFMFENRLTQDGKRQPMVGIACKTCHRTEWHTAPNAGWGTRIFKERGWLLGSTRERDKCPGCRKQTPGMAGVSTPARRRAAYLSIETREARRESIRNGTALDGLTGLGVSSKDERRPMPLEPVNPEAVDPTLTEPTKMAEALSALGKVVTTKEPEGPMTTQSENANGTLVEPSKRKSPARRVLEIRGSRYAVDGFSDLWTARNAATRYLQREAGITSPIVDVHFEAPQQPDGTWKWTLLAHPNIRPNTRLPTYVTPGVAGSSARNHKTFGHPRVYEAINAAKNYLIHGGVEDPQRGVDFQVAEEDDGWRWYLLRWPSFFEGFGDQPAEAATAPHNNPEPAPTETPTMTEQAPTLTALPPPQPTRSQVRAIQDALDASYDIDRQRYRGAATDATVAAGLALPRAWVSAERERAFGPDQNEASDATAKWLEGLGKQAAALANQAILLAEAVEGLQVAISKGPK